MTLNLKETANPGLVRLDPKKWSEKVAAFAKLKQAKKDAAAVAKAADDAHKAARAELLREMGTAHTVICGNVVLTRKEGATAEAALTMNDGVKIKWSDVKSFIAGNTQYERENVTTLFGGRAGSIELDIAGA